MLLINQAGIEILLLLSFLCILVLLVCQIDDLNPQKSTFTLVYFSLVLLLFTFMFT